MQFQVSTVFFFHLLIFYLSKIFHVYVARFVYLYLRKLESYPIDFHSLQQSINKRAFKRPLLFIPDSI